MRHTGFLGRLAFALLACAVLFDAAEAQVAGDVDCNGQREPADVEALIYLLFSPTPPGCTTADVNRDRRLSAADFTAFHHGPKMTFVGLSSADGRPISPIGTLPDGTVVVFRNAGFGFNIVIEAADGPDGTPLGTVVFDSSRTDPARRPDLQVQVDRTLGDGSRMVCDEFGIPAIAPVDYSITQSISDALNDIGCRFRVATTNNSTCTFDSFGQPRFVSTRSRVQFCFSVSGLTAFPNGETGISVQLRDRAGKLGARKRLMLQVERGPIPSTYTPVPPTETFTATPVDTPTPTRTDTRTRTATRPPRTATATGTATPVPTASRTPTRTPTGPVRTPTSTATGGQPTFTPTRSRTPSRSATPGLATPTRSPTTAGRTPTRTPTAGPPTRTLTRTRTRTITRTPTQAITPTRTRTRSPTPTASLTPGADNGPLILYFGLLRPDDVVLDPSGQTTEGIPFYVRPFGFGFSIVVEAGFGESRRLPGGSTFIDGGRPDLQIQVTRALGNGSGVVCDDAPPLIGGVPATNPPDFGPGMSLDDRMNDFGCRFVDGSGQPSGRPCDTEESCVRFGTGLFGCIMAGNNGTRQQYCAPIGANLEFPDGDTLVTARVRDVNGNLGPPAQLIVRVVPP